MESKRPVLVVDDNEINQVVLAEELELGGYEADLASDGKEALAKVKAGSYRMILMDCQMPVMDGLGIRIPTAQAHRNRGRHLDFSRRDTGATSPIRKEVAAGSRMSSSAARIL